MVGRKEYGGLGLRSRRFPSSKFHAPGAPSRLVRRSRLLDALDRGRRARLTLVVGSPGAGKTALLADWLAAHPKRPTAWLSCDPADAEPPRFVAAMIEALRRAFHLPELGEDARQLLGLDGEVSADVMAALAEDLDGLDGPRVLVIDDFHLTGAAGADTLTLLLECRPASLQLVLASRTDPDLRLHRMRANEELVELRDQDLSFSPEETRAFLSGFGVNLNERDLSVVHQRSEGWIAGLQMAALSIQRSPDAVSAAGRVELHRHTVAGYFLDEVLSRQPPELVEFMLATSILDELSVPACSALCGQGSAALVQQLYGAHLFVTRVDDEGPTYRYHQLIKEVLQAQLHHNDPIGERRLHERAAQYLADAGQVGPAARHLLAAGNHAGAFRLIRERLILDFAANPRIGSALDLDEIRPELFAGSPDLLVALAADLQLRGGFERGRRALALARDAGIDPDRQPELAVQLAAVNAIFLGHTGQLQEALAQRQWARSLEIGGGAVDMWLHALDVAGAYCHTYLGQFDAARQLVDTLAASVLSPPPVTDVLCPGLNSQIAFAEGALTQADIFAAGALESSRRLGFDHHYFAFPGLRTAAQLALERRHLDAAARLVEQILELVSGARPAFEYFAQLDRARIWAAAGNVEGALSSLPAARAALRSDHSVLFSQADELEAGLRLALGDRNGALRMAEQLPEDRRRIISALIALRANDHRTAGDILSAAPPQGPTIRSDLELRLLRAGTAIVGASPRAPELIREAVAVADRHGYVQTVLDTAPQVVDQLISDSAHYPNTDNVRSLIAAGINARKLAVAGPNRGHLPDPLTEAEIRVLEALPQLLTYADMAAQLHLSLNTVKTHLRHTYMKLGVTSRAAAVKRATSIGII